MSSESLVDGSAALSVDIPATYPSSSVESSLTSSPTGILGSSTSASLPNPSNLNVRFAPLPQLAPRKRRSTAPMGVAARAQIMQRRRAVYGNDQSYHHSNSPMWTDEELAQRGGSQLQVRDEEELEDPFLMFGRMVKGAGKQLWRKVSHKDIQKEKEKDEKGKESTKVGEEGDKEEDGPAPGKKEKEAETRRSGSQDLGTAEGGSSADTDPAQPQGVETPILRRSTEDPPGRTDDVEQQNNGGEGRVWEEEVGQTETIVEGHTKYSWASSVEIPPRPQGKRRALERRGTID